MQQKTVNSQFLENALKLAKLGYPVFPLVPKSKKPRTEHGFKNASCDLDQIKKWWKSCPKANVGIATAGMVVIDVDQDQGGPENPWPGDASHKKDLLAAPTAKTPRGGHHHYFAKPEGLEIKCDEGKIANKVDVRAVGGYVVAPPSQGSDGIYIWLTPLLGLTDLPLLPSWLLDIFHEMKRKKSRLSISPLPKGGDGDNYFVHALQGELGILKGTEKGNRNGQLNTSALKIFSYVTGGHLDYQMVWNEFFSAALGIGLEQGETERTLNSAWKAAQQQPRGKPDRSHLQLDSKKNPSVFNPDDICTLEDLKKFGAETRWLWPSWIQIGVVNVLVAVAGTGKTRLVFDLIRRVAHKQTWPDGTPIVPDSTSQTLIVASDCHHNELVELGLTHQVMDHVVLNASKENPYEGTMLQTEKDLLDLEGRIKACNPILVVVDTVLSSTILSMNKPEEIARFCLPLQKIAQRNNIAILLIHHTNKENGSYGRHIEGKARVVLRLSQPDQSQENRRRLEVVKTNSKKPPALGVTMLDNKNEYDLNPPEAPSHEPGTNRGTKQNQCREFIINELRKGASNVTQLQKKAGKEGYEKPTFFDALKKMCREKPGRQGEMIPVGGDGSVIQYLKDGLHWLKLPNEDMEDDVEIF